MFHTPRREQQDVQVVSKGGAHKDSPAVLPVQEAEPLTATAATSSCRCAQENPDRRDPPQRGPEHDQARRELVSGLHPRDAPIGEVGAPEEADKDEGVEAVADQTLAPGRVGGAEMEQYKG